MLDCIRGLYPWRRVRQMTQLRQSLPVMESPPTILISCPQEIIRCILGHLPPQSVAAFALTCRRFYPHLSSASLNEEARLRLLIWIEKDIPHLYLCHKCKDLHTWSRSCLDIGYEKHCRKGKEWIAPSVLLRFTEGRVVMNRHLYGKLHGPPLENFDNTTSTTHQEGVKQKECRSARIIGDELYFKVVTELYHNQGRARNLRERIDDEWFSNNLICQHVALTQSLFLDKYRTHELDRPLGSGELFVPVTGPLRSCRRCFTDFCIDVERCPLTSKTTKGWVITITRWHQLGKFRSTVDPKWHNYVDDTGLQGRIPWRDKVSGAGMVYGNWSAQDDGSAEHMAEDSIVQREDGFVM